VAAGSMARMREYPELYQSWGHSTFVDPMGQVKDTSDQDEAFVYGEVDLDYVEECRGMLPYNSQKRDDLYKLSKV
jgi:omega-amidase